ERTQLEQIDRDSRFVETHLIAVGDDARVFVRIDESTQLRQAPPQRTAWIVRDFPEQRAEVLAMECALVEREVREQRAGLLGRREALRHPVPHHFGLAQEFELETHESAAQIGAGNYRSASATPQGGYWRHRDAKTTLNSTLTPSLRANDAATPTLELTSHGTLRVDSGDDPPHADGQARQARAGARQTAQDDRGLQPDALGERP